MAIQELVSEGFQRLGARHAGGVSHSTIYAPLPPPENLTGDELIARMEAIAVRSASRPVVDPRSIDEIIGYDDFGLPR
jgi:hypothetical protein